MNNFNNNDIDAQFLLRPTMNPSNIHCYAQKTVKAIVLHMPSGNFIRCWDASAITHRKTIGYLLNFNRRYLVKGVQPVSSCFNLFEPERILANGWIRGTSSHLPVIRPLNE